MKNYKVLILIASALLLSAYACKQTKDMTNAEEPKSTEVAKDQKEKEDKTTSDIQDIIVDPTYMTKSTDKFTLLESTIDGDILSLLVQYGGGCETHEWALKTNGAYAKSLPPQITLNVEHNANNDMCRALVTDTIKFNIEQIKYPGTFQLNVKLKDFEKHSITYRYN